VTCEACFHALLAFENEHPAAFGAVHHLTVACYFLQHPRGYRPQVLDMWRNLIADSLNGRVTPRELQRRARRQFEGATRVRDPRAVLPVGWPTWWPVAVRNVLRPEETIGVDVYVARAGAWAEQTRDTLSPHI
jgi:hypothetical protein